jgi:glutaminyl-peptide cyclotransferase
MKRTVFLVSAFGVLALVGGILVFNHLFAQPARTEVGTPEARKAGAFDGERAITYLTALCDIGPRISGSEGMTKQQELLQKHFEKLGAKVELQKFEGKQPSQTKAVPMANMIVSWHPEAKTRVIVCGHYDTRPIADEETNTRNWRKPFVSANDGTSSVAFLMELGNHMKGMKTEVGVDFVLFDGEEYIQDRQKDKFFLGSDHFAAQYQLSKSGITYKAAILLDLFAGKGAVYKVEQNSGLKAGPLVEDVWKIADDLGVKNFVPEWGHNVQDDHIALNRVGIPAIDIIDFSYEHWHRLSDTPDKCSAESLANVAKVIMAWLQKVK